MPERLTPSRRAVVMGAAATALTTVAAACSSSGSGSGGGGSTVGGGGPSASSGSGGGDTVSAPPSSAPSGSITRGGDLVIARTIESQSMNKTTVFQNESIFVFEQLYETLYTVTPDGKGVRPWLATSYTVSKDQLTYTFKLRGGVKFHNGKPMTAADVKFSIDEATAASDGWGFINVAIKSTAAPSPDTFVVHLKYPWSPLVADLSLFSNGIIPAGHAGMSAKAFYNAPIGTGPFQWDVWDKGTKLTLKKFDGYWQPGKPYLDSATWTNTPDSNTRLLQLKGGQADIDEYPAWSTVAQIKATPNLKINLFPSTQTTYLSFNQKHKPFQDVHVRRAISLAIDREALVKAVLFGNGTPANSFMPPTTPYYDKATKGLMKDPAQAKKEMAASSVPNGFSTTLLIPAGEADDLTLAQIVQQELKALNITVKITQLDASVVNTKQQGQDYDMTFTGWTMDISDPDELVTFAVNPNSGAKSFYTSYNKPAVVKDSVLAAKTLDPKKRQQLYSQIQANAAEDAFMAFLYYSPYAYATSTKVNGFFVTPLGNYHLEDVWKSQ